MTSELIFSKQLRKKVYGVSQSFFRVLDKIIVVDDVKSNRWRMMKDFRVI